MISYFNTSYVMVQPPHDFTLSKVFGDFNTSYVMVQPYTSAFFVAFVWYFNTSYVMVQQIQAGKRGGTG